MTNNRSKNVEVSSQSVVIKAFITLLFIVYNIVITTLLGTKLPTKNQKINNRKYARDSVDKHLHLGTQDVNKALKYLML